MSSEERNNMVDALPQILIPVEVESIFRVTPQTRRRWAREGKLKPVRLSSGIHRYRKQDVVAVLENIR
jgi:predicted site-specific integrase-resolvase